MLTYCVEEHDPDERFNCPCSWDKSDDLGAEECAEDYYSNHDGWKGTWALTFILFDVGGKEVGRFLVERELVESFTASEVTRHQKTKR